MLRSGQHFAISNNMPELNCVTRGDERRVFNVRASHFRMAFASPQFYVDVSRACSAHPRSFAQIAGPERGRARGRRRRVDRQPREQHLLIRFIGNIGHNQSALAHGNRCCLAVDYVAIVAAATAAVVIVEAHR